MITTEQLLEAVATVLEERWEEVRHIPINEGITCPIPLSKDELLSLADTALTSMSRQFANLVVRYITGYGWPRNYSVAELAAHAEVAGVATNRIDRAGFYLLWFDRGVSLSFSAHKK